jgi:hypothetical protein
MRETFCCMCNANIMYISPCSISAATAVAVCAFIIWIIHTTGADWTANYTKFVLVNNSLRFKKVETVTFN